MAVQVSYPGVYIDEFTPGAPIEGVGTATAAFVGPTATGPAEPTKVTSWERFTQQFGDLPSLNTPYMWYAVRGFFQNGGQICYVARVSNELSDRHRLRDRAVPSQETVLLRARRGGPLSPPIQVMVAEAQSVKGGQLYRPTASITTASGSAVVVATEAEALQFRSGDVVTWNTWNEPEASVTLRVEERRVILERPLVRSYQPSSATPLTLRLADPAVGDTTLRLQDAAGVSAGSVIRLRPQPATGPTPPPQIHLVRSVETERISTTLTTYRVHLREGLPQALPLTDPVAVESFEFRLTVMRAQSPSEPAYSKTYDELGMDPEHRNYFARVINDDPEGLIYATPVDPPNTTAPPANRPADVTAASPLAGGQDDDPTKHDPSDYRRALRLLEAVDDVNLLVVPGRTDPDVQLAVISQCTRLKDRFAILDPDRGSPPFGTGSVELRGRSVETDRGHAALYYPWLYVPPTTGALPVLVPPSGHVAGVYARTDGTRGVHKAPAGMDAILDGVLGVERTMTDVEQGQLNNGNVNVIRVFAPGGRPRVWGARTTATDTNWRYVNVRRLMLFLEESIEEGIRWAVFEPNGPDLWQRLKRTVGDFLTRVWRDGALFGETPQQAFYVRCDEVLNPFSEQQLGRLVMEIGVRPAYPAEFIVVRIGISPIEAQIQE